MHYKKVVAQILGPQRVGIRVRLHRGGANRGILQQAILNFGLGKKKIATDARIKTDQHISEKQLN